MVKEVKVPNTNARMRRGNGWFYRYALSLRDDCGLLLCWSRGKWGIRIDVDYWHGSAQVRLGWVGLEASVASYNSRSSSACFWTGVRLYAGRGQKMRMVDSIEREQPVTDWMPHLSYTMSMVAA